MRQCLFCENKADSREHIIPDWILKFLEHGRGPFHLTLGKNPPIPLQTPERKATVVCSSCNQGWMNRLEDTVKPIISPLMRDISFRLDMLQQHTITTWAVKTSIVHNGATRTSPICLDTSAREQLRTQSLVPKRTAVWLGRFSHPRAIASTGLDVWLGTDDIPEAAHVHVTTIVIGYLTLQILTINLRPEYSNASIPLNPKPGPWDGSLIQIWPAVNNIAWPPQLTFRRDDDIGGPSIYRLLDRWRLGEPR